MSTEPNYSSYDKIGILKAVFGIDLQPYIDGMVAAFQGMETLLESENVRLVELPEPDYATKPYGTLVWKVNGDIAVILSRDGVATTYFQDMWDDTRPSRAELRAGAAAMLAAAARIEAAE